MKPTKTGIRRIINAFRYSYEGFISACKTEAAFRQELFICVIGILAAILIPVNIVSKGLMIATLFLILLAELVNTAIEAVVDRISQDIHPLSKKAKDVGSLCVVIAFIIAGIIWFTVLWNHFG